MYWHLSTEQTASFRCSADQARANSTSYELAPQQPSNGNDQLALMEVLEPLSNGQALQGCSTMYIGNLTWWTTEEEVTNMCSPYGPVAGRDRAMLHSCTLLSVYVYMLSGWTQAGIALQSSVQGARLRMHAFTRWPSAPVVGYAP